MADVPEPFQGAAIDMIPPDWLPLWALRKLVVMPAWVESQPLAALMALLGWASASVPCWATPGTVQTEGNPLVDQINQLLPQTQCDQCGYELPYARRHRWRRHQQVPPGGRETIDSLADLLDVEPQPLDAEHGEENNVAYIREDECIGCTKCIQACPVDAILGAAKLMHTVIVDECTGCIICVDPCPVDCIDMVPRKAVSNTGAGNYLYPRNSGTTLCLGSSSRMTTVFDIHVAYTPEEKSLSNPGEY